MRNGTIDFDAYLAMANRIDEQPDIADIELSSVESQREEINSLYTAGYRKGLSTGWRCLDPFYNVRDGELTVITGWPSGGKSSFVDNLMVNVSRWHGWTWAVFSAENYPISRHISGLAEIFLGRPFSKGPTPRMSDKELSIALDWLNQYFKFLQPREDSYSLNRIVELAAQVEGLNALVIDPWNELDHTRPWERREDEHISVSLTKLRWLARTYGIHVFVVAHPAKYFKKEGDKKPVVTLNEVKGASEWYAKADNGISVWRDEGDEKSGTEIHVQKIRFREVGRIGMAKLFYDRVTGRFIDPSHRPTIEELEREPFRGQF